MGLGGILQELKTEGVLRLYHDYRSGRLYDYSGNGNNGVATSGAVWSKKGLRFNGAADEVTVPASASLVVSSGSFIFLVNVQNTLNTETLLCGRDGGVLRYLVYADTLPRIRFTDNTTNAILSVDIAGARCFGISFVASTSLIGYVNGVSVGSFGANVNPIGTTPLLEIGNYTSSYKYKSLLKGLLIISRPLTATEHAAVYAQLENMTWNTKGRTPGPMMP